jgi:hypothetical protein
MSIFFANGSENFAGFINRCGPGKKAAAYFCCFEAHDATGKRTSFSGLRPSSE